ncbi:MAG: hypothetical protein M1834_008589 [Cirrosporium novae-zelandiae]|nr:MAG: hypothetical protein M1834_008589 [Cirrosporium novae-zelandiae]
MSSSPPPKQPEQASRLGQSGGQSPSRTIIDVTTGSEDIRPSFVIAAPIHQQREESGYQTPRSASFPTLGEFLPTITAPERGLLPVSENYPTSRPIAPQASIPASLHAPPPRTPRRAKAHVASACVNCKRKHLRCEERRPCTRCVQVGKEDSCMDVQHKKRGRPRLREQQQTQQRAEGRFPVYRQTTTLSGAFEYPPQFTTPSLHSRRPSGTLRELRSSREIIPQSPGSSEEGFRGSLPASANISPYPASIVSHPPHHHPVGPTGAIALLSTGLTIVRANQAFLDRTGRSPDMLGRDLFTIVAIPDHFKLLELRNWLQNERNAWDSVYPYSPGDTNAADVRAIRGFHELVVEQAPTRGQEWIDALNILGLTRPIQVSIRLVDVMNTPVVVLVLTPDGFPGRPHQPFAPPPVVPSQQLPPVTSAPLYAGQYIRPPGIQSEPQHPSTPVYSPRMLQPVSSAAVLERTPRRTHHQPTFSSPSYPRPTLMSPPVYPPRVQPPGTPPGPPRRQSEGFSSSLQLPPIRAPEGATAPQESPTARRQRGEESEGEREEQQSERRKKRVRIGIGEIS